MHGTDDMMKDEIETEMVGDRVEDVEGTTRHSENCRATSQPTRRRRLEQHYLAQPLMRAVEGRAEARMESLFLD